jgi:hypothetical protein
MYGRKLTEAEIKKELNKMAHTHLEMRPKTNGCEGCCFVCGCPLELIPGEKEKCERISVEVSDDE